MAQATKSMQHLRVKKVWGTDQHWRQRFWESAAATIMPGNNPETPISLN